MTIPRILKRGLLVARTGLSNLGKRKGVRIYTVYFGVGLSDVPGLHELFLLLFL